MSSRVSVNNRVSTYPVAYGILSFSQLLGDFFPTPQKTVSRLFDLHETFHM